ncbi:MAG: 3-isopropylmalate dehydratase small subunit [Chloroflexi bacterium]|nr:3-isopropylmalate dehydratase small subunit [Chloroflexota bacterium]
MKLRGTVHKYGANVDTDAIIPARYLNVSDPEELAKHCMEDIDADFVARVRKGDIIVATTNFGCGSSREHAPVAIKASGISCVVAASFARIFFRNAINIGLPLLESAEAADGCAGGDVVDVDLASGTIKNVTTGKTYHAAAYPAFLLDIISSGGLIEQTRMKLQSAGKL